MVQGEDAGALVALIEALKRLGYTFTTVTPSTHERVNRRPCAEQARNLRDVFGWSRPFDEGSVRGRGVNSRTALAGIGVAIGPCG